MQHRVWGHWILLLFGVTFGFPNFVSAGQCKAALAVFGEKMLGRTGNITLRMWSCWKCFYICQTIDQQHKVNNDLQRSEHFNKKNLHANEWGLLKVSELPTHSKDPNIFSRSSVSLHNCIDATVSEDSCIWCQESWYVFEPPGFWVLLSPVLLC